LATVPTVPTGIGGHSGPPFIPLVLIGYILDFGMRILDLRYSAYFILGIKQHAAQVPSLNRENTSISRLIT